MIPRFVGNQFNLSTVLQHAKNAEIVGHFVSHWSVTIGYTKKKQATVDPELQKSFFSF